MCNEREIKPLYKTIRTEFLEELMSAKYTLDAITKGLISQKHLQMVVDSMVKAKTKHPNFASTMTDGTIEKCRESLSEYRHNNDMQENFGCEIADEILNEEYLEAMEQYLMGNNDECGSELADTAAVVFCMMELNDSEKNRK